MKSFERRMINLCGACVIALGLLCLLAAYSPRACAQSTADAKMLAKATPYFGLLVEQTKAVWPDLPLYSFTPAQIEQESLWNPKAELKTSREYGFGFGQFTITSKFDAMQESRMLNPALAEWTYANRFDPRLQLIAILAKNQKQFNRCAAWMASRWDALACTAAAYNGGEGGFQSDRRLCSNTRGCDAQKWYGNIELYSLKQKTAVSGYGESFFQTNHCYPWRVMVQRRGKYILAFPEDTAGGDRGPFGPAKPSFCR